MLTQLARRSLANGALLAALACGSDSPTTPGPDGSGSGLTGKLRIFASEVRGHTVTDIGGVLVLDLATGQRSIVGPLPPRQVDDTIFGHDDLVVHPTGTLMVFTQSWSILGGSDARFGSRLVQLNADGTNPHVVVDRAAVPNYGRDGRLAYCAWTPDPTGYAPIFVNGQAVPTELSCDLYSSQGGPALFPAGDALVISTHPLGNFSAMGLYRVDLPSGATRRLAEPPGGGVGLWFPVVSPDGTRIAVVARTFDTIGLPVDRIWLLNADGTGLRPLTAGPGDFHPRWSPDGRYIAFSPGQRGHEGPSELDVVNVSSGKLQTIIPVDDSLVIGKFDWGP